MSLQDSADSFDKIREELREKFVCFICLQLATDPVVIPCCGQIVCSKCLDDWFSSKNNSTCPYCRQQLSSKKGIRIKWAEKLKKVLQISVQNCPTHHKAFGFYCKTCSCFLCADCLLDELKKSSSKHQSHSIIKLEQMLNDYKIQIQQELLQLLPKMSVIESNLNKIQKYNMSLTVAKNSVLNEMSKRFKDIKDDSEKQLDDYEKVLKKAIIQISEAKHKIEKEIGSIQLIIDERQLFQNSNKTISSSMFQKHLDSFNSIKKSVPDVDFLMKSNPQDKNDLILQFETFSVYIPKFKEKNIQYKNLPPDAIHFFYSQKVKLNGIIWRVKIYPNGNLNGEGTHLSIFLELIRGTGISSTYLYRLRIKSTSHLIYPDIQREYSSKFDDTDSWGWNKAASLDQLFNGNYLDKDGGLCIIFQIKAESNYQINLELENVIKRKIEKCKKLKNQLKELENSAEIEFDSDKYDSFSQ